MPERSKIQREATRAFAKRVRTEGEADVVDEKKPDATKAEAQGEAKLEGKPGATPATAPGSDAAKPTATDADPEALPKIHPPDPIAEPWPDATPQPMKPVVSPTGPSSSRARTDTVGMPPDLVLGKPPEMPTTAAPPPLEMGSVENPTHMPGPRDVPGGNADDPAPVPGRVPPGDSRSLRRGNEFALVYRVGTSVISRAGMVGKRGVWRVVEYPTSPAASHGYAKECSRFVSEGFSDYRD